MWSHQFLLQYNFIPDIRSVQYKFVPEYLLRKLVLPAVDEVDPHAESAREPIMEAVANIPRYVSSLLHLTQHRAMLENIASKFPQRTSRILKSSSIQYIHIN